MIFPSSADLDRLEFLLKRLAVAGERIANEMERQTALMRKIEEDNAETHHEKA